MKFKIVITDDNGNPIAQVDTDSSCKAVHFIESVCYEYDAR